jgi:hypothetical protein
MLPDDPHEQRSREICRLPVATFREVRGIPGQTGCHSDQGRGPRKNEDHIFTFQLRARQPLSFAADSSPGAIHSTLRKKGHSVTLLPECDTKTGSVQKVIGLTAWSRMIQINVTQG